MVKSNNEKQTLGDFNAHVKALTRKMNLASM